MLLKLLESLVQSETATFRRVISAVVLMLLALAFALVAVVILLISLYLWLSQLIPPVHATLFIGGGALLVSSLLFLVGRLRIARQKSRTDIDSEVLNMLRSLSSETDADDRKVGLAVSALAAGLIIGRRISR